MRTIFAEKTEVKERLRSHGFTVVSLNLKKQGNSFSPEFAIIDGNDVSFCKIVEIKEDVFLWTADEYDTLLRWNFIHDVLLYIMDDQGDDILVWLDNLMAYFNPDTVRSCLIEENF